ALCSSGCRAAGGVWPALRGGARGGLLGGAGRRVGGGADCGGAVFGPPWACPPPPPPLPPRRVSLIPLALPPPIPGAAFASIDAVLGHQRGQNAFTQSAVRHPQALAWPHLQHGFQNGAARKHQIGAFLADARLGHAL